MGVPELVRGSGAVAVLAALAGLVGAIAMVGFVRADGLASRTIATTTSVVQSGTGDYAAVAMRVVDRNGAEKKSCALLADTDEKRARGMMGRQDLGGYDALIFSFPEDVNVQFYMLNVPVALSIAWFNSAGQVVSLADMEPCTVEAAQCQRFSAGVPFRGAVEVLKGGLSATGIGEGSTIVFGGPCG